MACGGTISCDSWVDGFSMGFYIRWRLQGETYSNMENVPAASTPNMKFLCSFADMLLARFEVGPYRLQLDFQFLNSKSPLQKKGSKELQGGPLPVVNEALYVTG